jgi:START domain
VEHVEADDRAVHNLYKPLVNSGLAFGAKRWVGTLERQCERLASVMASNIPNGDIGGKDEFMYLVLSGFLVLWLFPNNSCSKCNAAIKQQLIMVNLFLQNILQ